MAINGKKKRSETINAETGKPEPTPLIKRSRVRLETPEDILKEMNKLYRKAKQDGKDATSLVWILGEIRKTMELTTLSDQVEKLKAMYLRYGAPELIASSIGPRLQNDTAKDSTSPGQ